MLTNPRLRKSPYNGWWLVFTDHRWVGGSIELNSFDKFLGHDLTKEQALLKAQKTCELFSVPYADGIDVDDGEEMQ